MADIAISLGTELISRVAFPETVKSVLEALGLNKKDMLDAMYRSTHEKVGDKA